MDILQFSYVPEHILQGIQNVHQLVFEGQKLKEHKLENKKELIVLVAIVNNEVAGFKMGYEVEDNIFYSWLGGVNPSFQKRGIANALMQKQHGIVKALGYKIVRTYSRNERPAMLILNIKNGFHVIDTFIDHKGRHKIRLEKTL